MDLNELVFPVAKIRGGARVPHCKNTAECESVVMPSPKRVVIPMVQHIGAPCEPVVNVGDKVFVGSLVGDSEKPVSAPVYSSVSGVVAEIGIVSQANGAVCKAVVVDSDGLDTPLPDLKGIQINTSKELVAAARNCGLVGLGGAGFPTHIKLSFKEGVNPDTLIINGAECEPYITSDYRSCMEDYNDVVDGVYLLKKILNFERVIIAVEDNKEPAIEKLLEIASDKRDEDNSVRVLKLKSHYPQGAEKVLVYTATGRRIPIGGLPSDVGCVVMNITSVAVLHKYIRTGMPLTHKRITVDGDAIVNPQNVIVPIGTSIKDVIDFCGGFKEEPKKILIGGPMMGIAVNDINMPVLKQNNAILAFAENSILVPEAGPCINCGRCHNACPMGLMPSEVDAVLKHKDADELAKLYVPYCIECGSCAYSCPAKRPLVQVMRLAKNVMRGAKNG